MYYKKLLRLYDLPEDCFNLFSKDSHSIENNTVSDSSSQDYTCVAETVVNQESSLSFAENKVKSSETTVSSELASNLSRTDKVDCKNCHFLVIDESSPGEIDYRCRLKSKYLSSTEVQCDNFEQKAEIPIEPEIDDYTG